MRNKGFTLLEMLAAIAIMIAIGVVVAVITRVAVQPHSVRAPVIIVPVTK